MTRARHEIVIEGAEGIYHCISRCVRRAYLCGTDSYTGKCYDHRKSWVKSRLEFLESLFAIDMLGYTLMDNHQHTLLKTRPEMLSSWSNEEVARRWLLLYPKKRKKDGTPKPPTDSEVTELANSKKRIKKYRKRLGSISWFMKCHNEFISRRANTEDGCKGHFWEGRFKCIRVEDTAGALTCAMYIDLNPIRAGLAKTPEESEYTSARERIEELRHGVENSWLAPIDGREDKERGFLPISTEEYLTLLDLTGRMIVSGKRGAISSDLPPLLERVGINVNCWEELMKNCLKRFPTIIGASSSMEQAVRETKGSWFKGVSLARKAFA